MNPFTIRPFQISDKEAVILLWQVCGLASPQNNPHQDIARKLQVNPEWFLVGERDGNVIASCMAGYEGHRGWINYLCVHPDHQRKGYAAQLMAEAESLLRKAGCAKINMQVREANTSVIEFYKKIGFSADAVISLGKRLEIDSP